MKFSEIGAALAEFKTKLTELAGKVTGLEAKVAPGAPAISADDKTAMTAEVTGLKAQVTALETAATSMAEALKQSTTIISGKDAEITKLTGELADKKKIATAGAAAAAGLAADQATPPVSAETDVDPNGKSPEENLRAKMLKETDPAKKAQMCQELRKMRGISFGVKEVKASA